MIHCPAGAVFARAATREMTSSYDGGPREIDALQRLAEPEQMRVRIDEARIRGRTVQIEHARRRPLEQHRIARRAHEHEFSAAHRERLGDRARLVDGVDAAAGDDEIRGLRRLRVKRALRRARGVAGSAVTSALVIDPV